MSMMIDEIVRKIRKSQNGNVHTISAKEAYELADCIEKAIEVERIEWRKMLKEAKDAIGVLEERRDAVEQCQTEEATCKDSLRVGNLAEMMAALKQLRDAVLKFNRQLRTSDYGEALDEYKCMKRGLSAFLDVRAAIVRANCALDLCEARNCDLFGGDPKKLHELWWEWSGDLKNCNADGTVKFTFGEWLLKLANAKGGEK